MANPDTCCTLVPNFKVAEIAKLREPLAGLKPKFFELANGIRR